MGRFFSGRYPPPTSRTIPCAQPSPQQQNSNCCGHRTAVAWLHAGRRSWAECDARPSSVCRAQRV
jgi:hypothetical protein